MSNTEPQIVRRIATRIYNDEITDTTTTFEDIIKFFQ